MNYACKSVIGRRRTNEDRCCAVSNARGSILLAVADGMGGHAAGEVASEMLIETLKTQAEHFTPLSLTEPALRNAILATVILRQISVTAGYIYTVQTV